MGEEEVMARLAMVMAGGGGLRFWPMSRAGRPKQLLPLAGEQPMVTETVERLLGAFAPDAIYCVTGARHVDAIREALPMLPPENIIDEPVGRDTAAAIALFAALAEWRSPGSTFCVLPADQVISPAGTFLADLERGFAAAETHGVPVSFGIPPTRPSTQYGYVQRGEAAGEGCHRVIRFREKPDLKTAKELLDSGDWFWNSGMFVWKASVILDRIRQHLPEHAAAVERLSRAFGTSEVPAEMQAAYARMPRISIDYGVMEKTEDAIMVPAEFDWSDVGSWSALSSIRKADAEGNVVDATWSGFESRNCIVVGPKDRLVATLGCEDMVIVQTADATLIAPRSRVDELKKLVEKLKQEGRERFL